MGRNIRNSSHNPVTMLLLLSKLLRNFQALRPGESYTFYRQTPHFTVDLTMRKSPPPVIYLPPTPTLSRVPQLYTRPRNALVTVKARESAVPSMIRQEPVVSSTSTATQTVGLHVPPKNLQ